MESNGKAHKASAPLSADGGMTTDITAIKTKKRSLSLHGSKNPWVTKCSNRRDECRHIDEGGNYNPDAKLILELTWPKGELGAIQELRLRYETRVVVHRKMNGVTVHYELPSNPIQFRT